MSGHQWSGPKSGVPPGQVGPAFRALRDAPGPGYGPRIAKALAEVDPEVAELLRLEVPDLYPPVDRGRPPLSIGTYRKQNKPIAVYNADAFLSALPPQGLSLFHRVFMYQGSLVINATTSGLGRDTRTLFTLDPGESLIVTRLVHLWMQSANSALEPDALEPFPQYWNNNGQVTFELLINNSAIFNAQEQLLDPEGGVPVTRQTAGFSQLGVNLLNFGDQQKTAAYLIEGDVTARWNIQELPDVIPTSVGVQIQGFIAPTRTVYETLIDVRRHYRGD